MKNIFSVLIFVIGTATFAQNNATLMVISPAEYKQELSKEFIQLIDIRTPKEFNAGAIQGAENIDFLAHDFLSKMEKFDMDEPLYIYCRSGNRSSKAAAQLIKIGFQNIIDLKGGYIAWKQFEGNKEI